MWQSSFPIDEWVLTGTPIATGSLDIENRRREAIDIAGDAQVVVSTSLFWIGLPGRPHKSGGQYQLRLTFPTTNKDCEY